MGTFVRGTRVVVFMNHTFSANGPESLTNTYSAALSSHRFLHDNQSPQIPLPSGDGELIPLFSSRLRHEKVYHGHQYHTHVVGTSAGRVGRPKSHSEDPFQRRQASHLVIFRSIHIHIHCHCRSRERYRYELPSTRK